MSNTQLDAFPDLVDLSPRLRWLAQHRLHTRRDLLPRGYIGPFNSKPWTCANAARTVVAFGETEADAEWAYAQQMGLTHYAMDSAWLMNVKQSEEDWG